MEMTKVLVGHCAVDSGQIMIADPCYLIDGDFTQGDYEAACEITLSEDRYGALPFRNGVDGKAVLAESGIGDGYYPVYASYMDAGMFGERIGSLTIDFSEHILMTEDEEETDDDE